MDSGVVLSGVADVVASVPFLVGHVPTESIVVVSARRLDGKWAVGATVRLDAGAVVTDPGVGNGLGERLAATGAMVCWVIVYRDEETTPEQAMTLAGFLDDLGLWVSVTECVMVRQGVWGTLASCGTGLVSELESAVPAAMVARGMSVAPSREEKTAYIRPVGQARCQEVARCRVGVSQAGLDNGLRVWRQWLDRALACRRGEGLPGPAPAVDVALMGALLAESVRFRDGLMLDLLIPSPGEGGWGVLSDRLDDPEQVTQFATGSVARDPIRMDAGREVFAEVARCSEGLIRARALGALAWLEWVGGDLGLAGDVARAAVEADPAEDRGLGGLVLQSSLVGMYPRWVPGPLSV